MDEVIEYRSIPHGTHLMGLQHSFERMRTKGSKGNPKKTCDPRHEECCAAVHQLLRLFRSDSKLLGEFRQEALHRP